MTNEQFAMMTGTHDKLDILFNMMSQNAKTQGVILESLSTIIRALKSEEEAEGSAKAPDTILIDILTKVEGIETKLRAQG